MVDFDKLFENIQATAQELPPADYSDAKDAIFTSKDLVNCNEIARIVRWLFIKNKIGESKYTELHKAYSNRENLREDRAGSDRGNTRKGLKKPDLSWKFLTGHILPLLNLQLVDLIIKVKDKDGKVVDISLNSSDQIPKDFNKTLDSADRVIINTKDAIGRSVTLDSKEAEK